MTEEDAWEKWCPHSRVAERELDPPPPAYNRLALTGTTDNPADMLDNATTCLGSNCMAWRWVSENRIHGYCGLSGRPQ